MEFNECSHRPVRSNPPWQRSDRAKSRNLTNGGGTGWLLLG